MLTPGQKLFEYKIVRKIGQGGFAVVYEAFDKILNRRAAIKHLQVKTGERAVKRFIQEARVAAPLEHPNVVTVYALRIEEQNIYMIMEYLPDGSLQQLLDQQGKLSVTHAVRLILGICEGLAKLHEQGIIHRDIKPENILLASDGRPKVADFGIAHVPESMGGIGLTKPGFQPSTLIYSSPEQFRGEELDLRSDVYQVGELLYYMLTGHHYIDIEVLATQVITEVAQQRRLDIKLYKSLEKEIHHTIPEDLPILWREVGLVAGVIEKAMAKYKVDRYKNTLELVTALNTIGINTLAAPAKAEEMALQNSRAYKNRGLAHASMRNYEQAIYDYSQAIELDPQYAEAYNNRSAAHLMMENYAQAVLDCNWAIELAPYFVAAYVNRGIAYTGLRNYDRALVDYNTIIELNPKNVYAHYNRGNTLVWMGQYEKAITAFSQTIALDPEFLAAYVNRGVVYDKLQNYVQAITDYNRAIELNPEYVHAYYNRANAHFVLSNYEQAIDDYSKVIWLNPEHPHAYNNRAKAYEANGDHDKAAIDHARIMIQIPGINPKELAVARSMLMPSTPLDFLMQK